MRRKLLFDGKEAMMEVGERAAAFFHELYSNWCEDICDENETYVIPRIGDSNRMLHQRPQSMLGNRNHKLRIVSTIIVNHEKLKHDAFYDV